MVTGILLHTIVEVVDSWLGTGMGTLPVVGRVYELGEYNKCLSHRGVEAVGPHSEHLAYGFANEDACSSMHPQGSVLQVQQLLLLLLVLVGRRP